jgi:hypothetical protein
MGRCHPTLQRLCPLSPWRGQLRPQIIARPLSMGPLQAPSAGFALTAAGSLVWGNKSRHMENREIGGALALGGHCLVKKTTINKMLVQTMEGMMESERGWVGVHWGVLSLCAGQQIERHQKYKNNLLALDGHVTIFHTQQPTKNTWAQQRRCGGRGATRGGMRGWVLFHQFDGN